MRTEIALGGLVALGVALAIGAILDARGTAAARVGAGVLRALLPRRRSRATGRAQRARPGRR